MLKRSSWLIGMLLAAALAACAGGSGSSGFGSLENAAIDDVLNQQRCIDFEGLLICPADSTQTPAADRSPTPSPTARSAATATDTPVPIVPPTNTPTGRAPETPPTETPTPAVPSRTATRTATPAAAPPVRIDTDVRDVEALECRGDSGNECRFAFSFAPAGLPADATYRVAVRTGDSPWRILEPTLGGPLDAPTFAADVSLVRPSAGPGAEPATQFAVLVYLRPPGGIPAEVSTLGASGADLAFVTPPIVVVPSAP